MGKLLLYKQDPDKSESISISKPHAVTVAWKPIPEHPGVKLYGVDSVFASTEDRKLVWSDLAKVPPEAVRLSHKGHVKGLKGWSPEDNDWDWHRSRALAHEQLGRSTRWLLSPNQRSDENMHLFPLRCCLLQVWREMRKEVAMDDLQEAAESCEVLLLNSQPAAMFQPADKSKGCYHLNKAEASRPFKRVPTASVGISQVYVRGFALCKQQFQHQGTHMRINLEGGHADPGWEDSWARSGDPGSASEHLYNQHPKTRTLNKP